MTPTRRKKSITFGTGSRLPNMFAQDSRVHSVQIVENWRRKRRSTDDGHFLHRFAHAPTAPLSPSVGRRNRKGGRNRKGLTVKDRSEHDACSSPKEQRLCSLDIAPSVTSALRNRAQPTDQPRAQCSTRLMWFARALSLSLCPAFV